MPTPIQRLAPLTWWPMIGVAASATMNTAAPSRLSRRAISLGSIETTNITGMPIASHRHWR